MAFSAPQIDRYYSSNPSLLPNRASSGTYKAPTVPPLRSAAALGRQQTLGPVFSDEEDGDDTEYIAARMRELQMGQHQSDVHVNHLRLQQQAIQLQQQYLLQQLLAAQSQSGTRGQPGSQEASMAHLQQLQLQQMHMAHLRQQVDPRLQAQLLSQLQAQPQDIRAQALAAQAQLQAQVYARAQKQKEEKARFEAKPNALPDSPPKATLEDNPKPSAPLGRFAQARQTPSTPFGELTALLARRAESQPVKAEDPIPAMSEDRLAARTALQSLGHGRPASTATQNRVKSNPFPMPSAPKTESTIRSVSLAQPLKPIRQPFGPPAPTNELGDRNFQSMARKAAGKGLGMLGRRGEASGWTSPVV